MRETAVQWSLPSGDVPSAEPTIALCARRSSKDAQSRSIASIPPIAAHWPQVPGLRLRVSVRQRVLVVAVLSRAVECDLAHVKLRLTCQPQSRLSCFGDFISAILNFFGPAGINYSPECKFRRTNAAAVLNWPSTQLRQERPLRSAYMRIFSHLC